MSVAAVATLAVVAGCGGSTNGTPSAPAVQRVRSATLQPGGRALSWPLPRNWVITLQAWFPGARSTLRIGLASATVMVFDGSRIWHHVRITHEGLVVDGRRSGGSTLQADRVSFTAQHGAVEIRGLLIRRGG